MTLNSVTNNNLMDYIRAAWSRHSEDENKLSSFMCHSYFFLTLRGFLHGETKNNCFVNATPMDKDL